jgi:hypothetical protein
MLKESGKAGGAVTRVAGKLRRAKFRKAPDVAGAEIA